MKATIGITENNLTDVALLLSKILADEYILLTKTKKAHWNIEGPEFYRNHKLFKDQYDQLEVIVDQIAQRIRKIGHYAPATLKQFLELTHLSEDVRGKNDANNYFKALLSDHESIILSLRGNIGTFESVHKDVGTKDYLIGLIELHETMAWMLRAHLA